jgi:hypothetical protein
MNSALPPDGKNVLGYAEKISKILQAGGLFAGSVVAARFLGYDKISVHDLKIPLNYVVVIIFIGTGFHVFWAQFIIAGLNKLADDEFKDPRHLWLAMLFDEIHTNKGLFLRGLVARSQPVRKGSRVALMAIDDPTTWLSYGLALLTILAIIPWWIDNGLRWAEPWWVAPAYATMAIILAVINWRVGALWIVMLSKMKDDPRVRRSLETDSLHPEWWDEYTGGSSTTYNFSAMNYFVFRQSVAICGFVIIVGIGLVIVLPHWWLWFLLGTVLVVLPILLGALYNTAGH